MIADTLPPPSAPPTQRAIDLAPPTERATPVDARALCDAFEACDVAAVRRMRALGPVVGMTWLREECAPAMRRAEETGDLETLRALAAQWGQDL